jgi:RNA polymerase sigma factor (sigma-70 family)
MPATPAHLFRHVRQLVTRPAADPAGDAALLERWVRLRDEDAFTSLVARHGPMVLRVCRNILADAHAAEDALQATFLVLARRAASVCPATAVAAWLFGVARRVALKARAAEGRRHTTPAGTATPRVAEDPLDRLSARELLALLDEEVARLPERYRLPLVVCCLEGRSVEESARLLGWKIGSVKGRLERGRRLLRTRLTRRGVELAALLAVGLAGEGLPAALVAATTGAAVAFAAGRVTAEASASEALARDALRRVAVSPAQVVAVVFLVIGVIMGAGALARAPGNRESAEDPPPVAAAVHAVDRFGDPLPAGALARLGTVRLRHSASEVTSVAFSRDGKALLSAGDDCVVCAWDPATGKLIRRFRPDREPQHRYYRAVLAPDGGMAAFVLASEGGGVELWSLETGKELHRFAGDSPLTWIAFSSDSSVLAIRGDKDKFIRLWSTSTGREIGQLEGRARVPLTFSPEGKLLVTEDDDGKLSVNDLRRGRQLQHLDRSTSEHAGVSFAPDGRVLAVARDTDVDLQEVETGRLIRRLGGHSGVVMSVAFGPGDILVSTDRDGVVHSWDWRSGKELCRGKPGFGADPFMQNMGQIDVQSLAFSPDGKTVAFAGFGTAVRLWDVRAGRELLPREGHDREVSAIAYSPDGRVVATGAFGGQTPVRLWAADTGQPLAACEGLKPAGSRILFSPEGRNVLAAVWNTNGTWKSPLRMWDTASGREVRRFSLDGTGAVGNSIGAIALLPGGKTVRVFLYDAPAPPGKEAGKTFMAVWEWSLTTNDRRLAWRKPKVEGNWPVLSADGSLLAVSASPASTVLKVFDAATGRPYRDLDRQGESIGKMTFSADGRLVAAVCCLSQLVGPSKFRLTVWELATAKEVWRFDVAGWDVIPAFSPDGSLLAAGGHEGSPGLVWDLATGREVRRLSGYGAEMTALAFGPDSRTLTTGHSDGSALVWDVSPALRRAAGTAERDPAALERAWTALAGEDATAAQAALATLSAAPEQAMAFIRGRLRPAAAPRIPVSRLVADLDSDEFRVRESAARELARLGPQAEAALRAALAGKPSPELRKQAEALLEKLEGPVTDAETLRPLRAVAALERIGAAAVLRELAKGDPDALLTREAKTSLARLEARTAPAP